MIQDYFPKKISTTSRFKSIVIHGAFLIVGITRAWLVPVVLLLTLQPANAQQHSSSSTRQNIFIEIMNRMMEKMDAVKSTGIAEGDFIAQMIPHHEGAIEMSRYEIQHGNNFEMIQLAKSILAEQTNEVQQMKLWMSKPFKAAAKTTGAFKSSIQQTMDIMMEQMPPVENLKAVDKAFAMVMIPHHQAAINMARVIVKFSADPQINVFAKYLLSSEQIEIEQMASFIKK